MRLAYGFVEWDGLGFWYFGGASQLKAYFFAVAHAVEAPESFTGGGIVDRFLTDVGLLVVVVVWGGGMKRLEMSRLMRWRLAHSVAMVS